MQLSEKQIRLETELNREIELLEDNALWRNVAFGIRCLKLVEQQFSEVLPCERSPASVRRQATRALEGSLFIIQGLGLDFPKPLLHLLQALEDLQEGFNSPLLVTGELANKLPAGQFARGWRRKVRANASAIVEFLLSTGLETGQERAAEKIAKRLEAGGYSSRHGQPVKPDTVKRWHNRALQDGTPENEELKRRLYFLCQQCAARGPAEVKESEMRSLERMCRTYRLAAA